TGSVTSVSAAELSNQSVEKIRVLVEASSITQANAVKAQHGKRWGFSATSFSTEMTEKQFQALQNNKNLKLTLVDELTVAADLRTAKKPGTVTPTAEYPSQQVPWGIKAIYNNSSLSTTTGGAGINIAVLDTGVNVNHLDLVNTVEQCKDFTTAAGLTNGQCND